MDLGEVPTEEQIRRQRRLGVLLDWLPVAGGAVVVVATGLLSRSWLVFFTSAIAFAVIIWLDRKFGVLTIAGVILLLGVLQVVFWLDRLVHRESE